MGETDKTNPRSQVVYASVKDIVQTVHSTNLGLLKSLKSIENTGQSAQDVAYWMQGEHTKYGKKACVWSGENVRKDERINADNRLYLIGCIYA